LRQLKLTPGVNFINILPVAFAGADTESEKKTDKLNVFLALLGSACIKAARRTCFTSKHAKIAKKIINDLIVFLCFWDHEGIPKQMPAKCW